MKKEITIKFKATLNYYLTSAGYTKQELATLLHISKSTLYNKIGSPDKFTVGEIKKIKNILRMSDDAISFIWN